LITSLVVDTNVISFIFKQDTRGDLYKPHLADKLLIISFMTKAELDQWTLLNKWGDAKRRDLAQYLKNFVVINSDSNLCLRWAEIKTQAKVTGRPIETADAWIAATALLYRATLVTHNRRDFLGVSGLNIICESS